MNANESPLGFFSNILGFPGRLQGLLLNAVINTIDRAQTEHAIKEMQAEIAKSATAKSPSAEAKVENAADNEEKE
jgi:hypothetical protein